MSLRDECALLREALDRNPASPLLRQRLAALLNEGDEFDETIALLTEPGAGEIGMDAWLMLATACLARDAGGDLALAAGATAKALPLAETGHARSRVLALHAKVLSRQQEPSQAKSVLHEALDLDPHNIAAFKRLAVQLFRENRMEEIAALCGRLQSTGVLHARVLAARMLALAALGRIADSRAVSGLPVFLDQELLPAPQGWSNLEEFNAALIREVTANPARRFERHGTASQQTWRIDDPAIPGAPAARALIALIAERASAYAATLSGRDHPWLDARPLRTVLRSWCVITGARGYEQWHMHPYGWMSGGYYADVPPAVAAGHDRAGCLAFGLPDGLIGKEPAADFGEVLVRPKPGLLTLFPSHAYHRTFPHETGARRICFAFDIRPE